MPAGPTYEPIATTTLGSATASITFSSISTAYTDLIIVGNGTISTVSYFDIQVGNGSEDTGTNYSFTRLIGFDGTPYTDRYDNATQWQPNLGRVAIGNVVVQINNYSNTTTFKPMLSRDSSDGTALLAGVWRSTAAINYIKIKGGAGNNIASGTTFTIYGIKAA
jgi:hypothetical protein